MKRFVTIAAFFGVFVMLTGVPSAIAAPATPERFSTGWVSFDGSGFNNCGNEWVTLTGMYSEVFQVIQDGAGGAHLHYGFSLRGTGVGQDSGAGYVTSEAFIGTENYPQAGTVDIQITAHGIYVSMDPAVPDLHYQGVFHLTMDANGNPTASVDRFILCP